jgi:hypothetical protein
LSVSCPPPRVTLTDEPEGRKGESSKATDSREASSRLPRHERPAPLGPTSFANVPAKPARNDPKAPESDYREVSQSQVDTAGIRRAATLTYGAAETCIALGQRMLGEAATGQRRPARRAHQATSIVRELDQVSEHLLAVATHLARLAAVLEQAGPPGAASRPELADPGPGS